MSKQYPGGVISKTPTVPSGPYENSTASGMWTVEQVAELIKEGNWPTAGNKDPSLFIENLFSSYLYTGNGSTQTITNGIDLSTKGGLTWVKQRSATRDNVLFDTARGATQRLFSNLTLAQSVDAASLTAFNSTGFSIGSDSGVNINAGTYASWTFREQAKFFDIVTYTGTGVARTIAHNLGSAPGFIIVKRTDTADEWFCYHRSLGQSQQILLNSTAAAGTNNNQWNNTAPTSSVFSLGTDSGANGNGGTYVAYLFAHDAGGFGVSGTDNVISCGSMAVGGGVDAVVNLGYEPQWVMFKQAQSGGSGNWRIADNMRGVSTGVTTGDQIISANLTSAEADAGANLIDFTPTGFIIKDNVIQGGNPYIYVAIRRGPMKVPTLGTTVFNTQLGVSSLTATISSGFVTDAALALSRPDGASGYGRNIYSRVQGSFESMNTTKTDGEATASNTSTISFRQNNGIKLNGGSVYNADWVYAQFQRAPSFMDVVCYTGTGSATTFSHNLQAVPELMIVKQRSATRNWNIYSQTIGASDFLIFNTDARATDSTRFNGTSPTSSVFSVGTSLGTNESAGTYVAYLFATCAGVSKVGSYTGTATTKQIDCGFTTGARFVLIKRTDSTGDWYVWDTTRGIISGNDPYLFLNSDAAEVTNTDYIDPYNAGFELSSTAPAAINASGGTYIFLAIA